MRHGGADRLPESASLIFTAHFMILKDKNFTGRMAQLIEEGVHPIGAVKKVARKYIDLFSASPQAYMRKKAVDVEDLSIRILSNFQDATTRKNTGQNPGHGKPNLQPGRQTDYPAGKHKPAQRNQPGKRA